MQSKVNDFLDKLSDAIDNMTDEELVKAMEESGVTEETAKQYATIENIILKELLTENKKN